MKKIKLIKNQYTLVSDCDYERLSKMNWYLIKNRNKFYVRNLNNDKKMIEMHRLILDYPKGIVDHINGNGLDNRRENLRITDYHGNARNRKPKLGNIKGISHCGSKWRAQIFIDGKNKHLGLFDDKEKAARAYDVAAKLYYKEFAYLNYESIK